MIPHLITVAASAVRAVCACKQYAGDQPVLIKQFRFIFNSVLNALQCSSYSLLLFLLQKTIRQEEEGSLKDNWDCFIKSYLAENNYLDICL